MSPPHTPSVFLLRHLLGARTDGETIMNTHIKTVEFERPDMLAEAQSELVIGKWWQLVAASVSMALLVTAFSMLTDSLRDALDPKIK